MFLAIVRDAWRQYRRRPLAAVITVVVGGLPVFLEPEDPVLAVPLAVILLAAGLLVELFLVSWLAGAIDPAPSPTPAAAALATMRRTIGPGVRAGLLRAFYLLGALMVGLLLFGSREGGEGLDAGGRGRPRPLPGVGPGRGGWAAARRRARRPRSRGGRRRPAAW